MVILPFLQKCHFSFSISTTISFNSFPVAVLGPTIWTFFSSWVMFASSMIVILEALSTMDLIRVPSFQLLQPFSCSFLWADWQNFIPLHSGTVSIHHLAQDQQMDFLFSHLQLPHVFVSFLFSLFAMILCYLLNQMHLFCSS